MDREQFIETMANAKLYDLTRIAASLRRPGRGKVVGGALFKRVRALMAAARGQRPDPELEQTVGTHLVGETAFHSGGRAISTSAERPVAGLAWWWTFRTWCLTTVLYTPQMITSRAKGQKGDILIIKHRLPSLLMDQPTS